MTKKQAEAMIKLFHKCVEMGKGSFTILDQEDMSKTFSIAANRLTKVCMNVIIAIMLITENSLV
jgi:hypothetical protein